MADNEMKIVSSAHLVSERAGELSELEFGLTVLHNAFNRWMVRCMSAAGDKEMTALEVQLIHHVAHRNTPKKLADICFVLNIEDTHVVNYGLKKLVRQGLLSQSKVGKELLFTATETGQSLCQRYAAVRERCLIETLLETGIRPEEIGRTAGLLRMLAGLYDQAARAGASF